MAELEKTIGLMKKVMEKTQAENEKLKKSPAVVQSGKLEQLQMDNKSLKVRCQSGQLERNISF